MVERVAPAGGLGVDFKANIVGSHGEPNGPAKA
jgi:hypothetical protein